eukprot:CAMPEP_0185011122 /NCGR_PEP_ID=MMETSP1098-20130426/96748_1 /TAXON_ID=89044 /ORGANISM="Spumella elongata, Strain CCAP 955/1" /LENGTH=167 /DNA_ID=CAMNT_0027540107 /DNA_START=135 /DNA_END=635 /DNA_ORIENTATION=+
MALGVGRVSASNQLQRGSAASQPVQGVAVDAAGAPVAAVGGGDGGLDVVAAAALTVTAAAAVAGLDFGGDESLILVGGLSSETEGVKAGRRLWYGVGRRRCTSSGMRYRRRSSSVNTPSTAGTASSAAPRRPSPAAVAARASTRLFLFGVAARWSSTIVAEGVEGFF